MSDDATTTMLAREHREFARMQRRVLGEFTLTRRHRLMLAAAVAVAVLGFVLPVVHTVAGWQALVSSDHVSALARVFLGFGAVCGIALSTAALVSRRWRLAWFSGAGCALGSVFGMLAYWSHHSAPQSSAVPDVSAGMLVEWLALIALTLFWMPVLLRRPSLLERHGL
ncbi:hypothetical protein DW322_10030 [Rhodococcus rhodnii]|uniref:Transmembrane protein n=2 Tax=Rhodococcus rhodnii TaxID=38312 RepID=R7WJN1_9NOCA|nr:hypothetical protein [Rhodococcus rhodnii]EOM75485.1 hypothetical protein Rrhod_3283 [Rhodococcus rhodnii LMG 5362]TXG90497.1 hypothetical protein DW322_10030 [Rhodococcus rhodnii]